MAANRVVPICDRVHGEAFARRGDRDVLHPLAVPEDEAAGVVRALANDVPIIDQPTVPALANGRMVQCPATEDRGFKNIPDDLELRVLPDVDRAATMVTAETYAQLFEGVDPLDDPMIQLPVKRPEESVRVQAIPNPDNVVLEHRVPQGIGGGVHADGRREDGLQLEHRRIMRSRVDDDGVPTPARDAAGRTINKLPGFDGDRADGPSVDFFHFCSWVKENDSF